MSLASVTQPRLRVAISLFVLCTLAAQAQQPQLTRRPDQPKPEAAPPPPPLPVPAKLEPAHAPNSNATYQALRQRTVNGEAFTVDHLSLKRDAGVFTLISGTVYLYGPVEERSTERSSLATVRCTSRRPPPWSAAS
jgi:hypothetical protein